VPTALNSALDVRLGKRREGASILGSISALLSAGRGSALLSGVAGRARWRTLKLTRLSPTGEFLDLIAGEVEFSSDVCGLAKPASMNPAPSCRVGDADFPCPTSKRY
jgi:hypothetical protein